MPNHPDLTDFIRRLDKESRNAKATQKQLTKLTQEVCRRLRNKFPDPGYVIRGAIENLESCSLNPNPENIKSILETEEFRIALGRKVDATFKTHPKRQEIYCGELETFVDAVRLVSSSRLIIQNPFALRSVRSTGPAIQSWSRPSSMSQEYNRHLRNSKKSGKSKFSHATDVVESIEYLIFNSGIGRMTSEKQMFFYGKFSSYVGRLANNGTNVSYVRLQCDRTARQTGRGTRVEIHAYPIGLDEIKSDFANCLAGSNLLAAIEHNVFDIPTVGR